ncbi:uncharacterized protein LOC143035334 isoform X2 [Oratosquilla oratoria]
MSELEETWTEQTFYDRPLSVWTGDEEVIAADIFTSASIGWEDCIKQECYNDKEIVNRKNKGQWTPLMYAAYYGHKDVVLLLMNFKASVHIRNDMGCTALMLAAMCGNDEVVKLLLKAGSILETRDSMDRTALFHAVCSGHHGVTELLLKHRANPNTCKRGSGQTPLIAAAGTGDVAMVSLLLQYGALPSLTTHQGHCAIRIAHEAGYSSIVTLIQQWSSKGGPVVAPQLEDGPAAVEAKRSQMRQRGGALCVDSATVVPTDLESLLNELGLHSYMNVFREQDVDLQVFLTLTDQDLKECGIQKLGPRRKMTSAIARWHSNAPLRSSGVECAYADKLEVEMQELGVRMAEAMEALQQTKKQVTQERELRGVTEGWLVEARGRLQQCFQILTGIRNQLSAAHHLCSIATIQPSIIPKLTESMAVALKQVDFLMALSDPNMARGTK